MPTRHAMLRLAQSLRRPRRCLYRDPDTLTVQMAFAASHTSTTHNADLLTASKRKPRRSRPSSSSLPPPLVLNLGNNITVELPSTTQRPKMAQSQRTKQKEASHKQPLYAPPTTLSSAENSISAAANSKSAEGTAAIALTHTHADTSLTSSAAFMPPQSGAAAAVLLHCDTMFDALAAPVSVAPFSLPPLAAKVSPAEAEAAHERAAAARANFSVLQTTALPVLFRFAAEQQRAEGALETSEESDAGVVDGTRVSDALESLRVHLDCIAAAARCDGRRHVSALPPPVVAALWDSVMPFVHPVALARPVDGTLRTSSPSPENTNEDEGEVARPTALLLPQRQQQALTKSLKSSYLAVRRALALHTRTVAPLLPPAVLSMVLTRLYQCGALSDDILGPVIAGLVEAQRTHATAVASSSAASKDATVGGTISILQNRVLRLGGACIGEGNGAPTTSHSTFQGAAAITMARLLGKTATPGHHQLHSFFHLSLLPEVARVLRSTATAALNAMEARRDAHSINNDNDDGKALSSLSSSPVAGQPGADALLDLTSAFRHYAVSGEAVQHLTTLWRVQFATSPEVSWEDCATLMRALSKMPVASSRSRRRQARQLESAAASFVGARPDKLRRHMVEEDYYPLMEEVFAQVRQLGAAAAHAQDPHRDGDGSLAGVKNASPSLLLSLLRMLLRVNSPQWAETYEALATAIVVQLASRRTPVPASAVAETFSLVETQRTLTALLHRNSLIPDHPLHRALLHRVLHAPEALTDASVAAAALLSFEVMIPLDEGSEKVGRSDNSADDGEVDDNTARAPSNPGKTLMMQVAGGVPSEMTLNITVSDRARALQLLRRHGRTMDATAFVAGLCIAPIQQLPLATQTALVNHLTSVASAVPPLYLVKGVAAAMSRLHPSAVDEVSVRQWYSRFTAIDVVKRVDAAGCAVLLDMLSSHPHFEQHCTIAKQAITRRVGVALLRSEDDDYPSSSSPLSVPSAVTLGQLPQVVSALRRANVFLPPYFSRVCRMLLGQVETAALGDLLLPFSATAEEFMRRQQREGQASVFKDVWELLRGRVLEQVETLTLEDTCTALSAFAALDVSDRALFGVLVYRLWTCVQRDATAAGEAQEGEVLEVQLVRQAGSAKDSRGGEEGEAETAARRVAHIGEHITRLLSPSAISVVVTTLCAREDATHDSTHQPDAMVQTMLSWMLLALRHHRAELYPIDVVHLLPSLLQRFTAAAQHASSADMTLPLLHAAYDACRATFLDMYAVLPQHNALPPATATTATATSTPSCQSIESHVVGSTLTAEEMQRMAAQRAEWTPAVKLSVQVVPRLWFVPLLLTLSSAEVADVDVGLACVERACTRRVCSSEIAAGQLVDLCLTMCWLFRVSDFGMDKASNRDFSAETVNGTSSDKDLQNGTDDVRSSVDAEAATGTTATSSEASTSSSLSLAGSTLRRAMATVLSALWYRCDELGTAQINALLRCLSDTYGADRVDSDFVERLEKQKVLLQMRREKKESMASARVEGDSVSAPPDTPREARDKVKGQVEEEETSKSAAAAAPPLTPLDEMHADDLFSMM